MKKLLLASMALLAWPMAAFAGPKEDAFSVVEQFNKTFDASDVRGVVKLFAPDAVFLGPGSPKLATKTEDIDAYFQAIKNDTRRKVVFGDHTTLVLSDTAVLFAGMHQFSSTRDGKTNDLPARFTILVRKGSQGWRISHFLPLPVRGPPKTATPQSRGRQARPCNSWAVFAAVAYTLPISP